MKKIVSKTIHYSAAAGKRALRRSPRLKRAIKRVVQAQLGLVGAGADRYKLWLQENYPDFIAVSKMRKELATFTYKPKISILVPTYNTDPQFLRDCLDSVLGQVYENWELCIIDDASPNQIVRDIVKEYAAQDKRITYKFLKKNQHIARATNAAIELATGEFVALFDHDDLLWANALFEVVKALNQDKKLDFIYTDEDKISENRHDHFGPFFKPDWNPDFLHSVNYITHFVVIRRELLQRLGGMRHECDGAQDWDLALRVAHETTRIHHVPKVVYSWRVHDQSTAKSTDTKPYVVAAQQRAISDDLKRRGYSAKDYELRQDRKHPGYWELEYKVRAEPKISIVIPTINQYKIVKRCIDSIYSRSTYRNFEIILVDTGSSDKRVFTWYEQMAKRHENFKWISWPEKPFSYARSCNEGARLATGELLVMLNNDTEVLTPNWLEKLAGDAQRPEIGAVGCLLFFPDKMHIQHAGVGVGLGGIAANSFSMMTLDMPMTQTQHLMINTKHNMTVVTAACLMIRKDVFDEVGGFDEEYRITYNDVDLCLRLREKGYLNLYTPHVRLVHHESISVGLPEEVAKRDTAEFRGAKEQFKKQWHKYIEHDPDLNANLDRSDARYDPYVDPELLKADVAK